MQKEDEEIKEIEEKEPKLSLTKQFIIQMTAGAGAGIAETSLMHPFDTIKTRMQLQKPQIVPTYHPKLYYGILDCIYKMIKHEGFFSIWNGVGPALIVEIPRNALKFFMVEQYINLFKFNGEKTSATYFLAGLAGGINETLLITPFEVVKTHMQANKSLTATNPSSNIRTAKRILKRYGIGTRGLYRGLMATIIRESFYSTICFGFYLSMKNKLSYIQDPLHQFLRDLSLGFTSGLFSGFITTPFDTAKSKIQGPQSYPFNFSTYSVLQNMYKNDGIRGLYSGLIPRTIRLSCGTSILFVVYDRINVIMTHLMLSI